MPRKKRMSQGLTIAELLLVIFILVLVIGLVLVALPKVREPAKRVKCADHLKQIALAIHAYAASNQVKLPGVLYVSEDTANVNPFFYSLLPYLKQDALYKAGQVWPTEPWTGVSTSRSIVMQIPIESFQAPPTGA